ncbi:hypothetical protein GCM10027277_33600 [Pseudoduganella ginsengisoli]|uniref:Exported signal peptide protein n=1 Tax=Pseudoduganella ginsengisoli TaxID=1462440 RepID=A0A6L6Q7B1_9BURK|nr:hypothetical protein [Pseudoduganella ginsengisoli]MTW05344.1 hypothetical protein [Pseudoduganella ginsengisoli]
MKTVSHLFLACALALGSFAGAAHAEVDTHAKAAKKAAVKGKKAAKPSETGAAPAVSPADKEEADEPSVTDSSVTEFNCELGNKIAIYTNAGDDDHIALRWKKRLHRLTRVGTTTGAHRFENKLYGLIWIGIPAKGMLLDSKQNRQLANECKSPEQLNPAPAQG